MAGLRLAVMSSALAAAAFAPAPAGAQSIDDPLRFFEGRTESVSTVKVLAGKPYRSRSLGRGRSGATEPWSWFSACRRKEGRRESAAG